MPQLDPSSFASQLFWLVLSFGCLYLVLSRVSLPRLTAVLAERQAQIDGNLAAAERARGEAEAILQSIDDKMAAARVQAMELTHAAREKARAEMAKQQSALDARLAELAREADARIMAARDAALAHARAQAGELAAELVKHITGLTAAPSDIAAALEAQEVSHGD